MDIATAIRLRHGVRQPHRKVVQLCVVNRVVKSIIRLERNSLGGYAKSIAKERYAFFSIGQGHFLVCATMSPEHRETGFDLLHSLLCQS